MYWQCQGFCKRWKNVDGKLFLNSSIKYLYCPAEYFFWPA